GGPMEYATQQRCKALMQNRVQVDILKFSLDSVDAADGGMTCGGRIDILLERINTHTNVASLTGVTAARAARSRAIEAVVVGPEEGEEADSPTPRPGARCIYSVVTERMSDVIHSHVGSPPIPGIGVEDLAAVLREGRPTVLEMPCGRVSLVPITPRPTAYIFGGGHCGQALGYVLPSAGFGVEVYDDRPEFTDPALFSSPKYDATGHCHTVSFKQTEGETVEGEYVFGHTRQAIEACPDMSFVVIVTRGHQCDLHVLQAVLELKEQPRYIGMIGSRRKIATVYEQLKAVGITESQLATVHAPVGIDIGGDTPGQIAIAICGEMLLDLYGPKRKWGGKKGVVITK
ncbi:hypothetical protein KIPB_008099, partial [Kipferlia bialata]